MCSGQRAVCIVLRFGCSVPINVEHVTHPNMTLSECLKFKKGWEKSATHYQGIYTATDCIPTKNLYSSKTIKS